MSIWEHSRHRVFNVSQHPYRHTLSEFFYNNPRLPPGFSTAEDVLNYLIAVIYPNYIGTFATPAALPGVASPNDYALVDDDGDGKAAGYVYTSLDGVSAWHKRYDVDWSMEAIMAETINRTQYQYVHKYGFTDTDDAGVAIAGLLAGQQIWGGDLTGQNLTLNANSADGTGYVQTVNHLRATTNNVLDLGTATEQWRTGYFATSVVVGTTTIAPALITDSTGTISFSNENLTTTGTVSANIATITTSATVGTLALSGGSITDTSGAISFANENLSTTGTLASGTHTVSADLILATGSITSASGAITFDNENLTTTGTLGAGNTTVTRLDSDNIRLDGNTISILDVNGNLILQANGTGVIDAQSAMTTLGITATGIVSVTGQLNVDNLRLDGNVISSTNLNGNITFTPNGSGIVESSARLSPSGDNTLDLGNTATRWRNLYLGTGVNDGTNNFLVADLMTLRSVPFRDFARTIPAVAGDALFWDAVNQVWLANHPDTEILHSELSGLTTGDAGHTQFVMLAGRAGGQTIQGGTAASETLVLESTAHATKGNVLTKDDFLPFTDATYAAGWLGTDLGDSTHYFRDLYTKGEAHGLRLENFTFAGLPAASAQNVGRLAWSTDHDSIYADIGGSWFRASMNRHIEDLVSTGVETTFTVTVSANIIDARNSQIQLCDNANDYERIWTVLKAISATQVRVELSTPLPAGSYRLIVQE